jgi:hypothetical protein
MEEIASNTLSAAATACAILLRVHCAIFRVSPENDAVPGKIRLFELQFLHSYPDIIDFDLTLLAPRDAFPGASSHKSSSKSSKEREAADARAYPCQGRHYRFRPGRLHRSDLRGARDA